MVFGWPYAIGMVGLIFVHECGHLVVMRRYGVPFSPMVFIPFVGAVIAQKGRSASARQDAMIALGGPALGSVAALATAAAGHAADSQLLMALGDWGFMINLFNLLPIGSLDGGRVADALNRWLGVGGLALGGALLYAGAVTNPIFYLVMLSGVYTTGSRFYGGADEDDARYYDIGGAAQAQIALLYFALVAALVAAMRENNRRRKTPSQLAAEADGYAEPYDRAHGADDDGVYDDYASSFFGEQEGGGGRGGGRDRW